MQTHTDCAALLALDWGDTTHSFAWQKMDNAKLHRGTLPATPAALREWLEHLREACWRPSRGVVSVKFSKSGCMVR